MEELRQIHVIRATKDLAQDNKIRVAAYCRVSSDSDDQVNSFMAQVSGHLVCDECGGIYRRITKHDGSIVWRCVNRVEKGGVICEQSPTIPEEQLILAMVNILGEKYRDCEIHNKNGKIRICKEGSLEVEHDAKLNLTM